MSKQKSSSLRSPSSRMACAIYTRKSSEEGMDQDFNSLDAQREACESYVQSQKAEGWLVLPDRYDDGGYTGGNMERPALRQLMADIALKRIRIVVVYKVDRLTRSLADFAKLVELFDAHGVSFVSVTQQFNTTSSMGRLTLNVLLSFAQFEREITGERIRDKIAASKAKGMGGNPPMGYIPKDRTLVIDEPAALQVREIFNLYLTLGCVSKLKTEIDRLNWKTQARIGQKSMRVTGNRSFSRGHLYRILTSPLYIGQIGHKDKVYPGQHRGIIEQSVWDAVQAKLSENRQGNRQRTGAQSMSLLAGLVWDDQGGRLTPSHSKKGERRYRYYISNCLLQQNREDVPDALRIPANELEGVVMQALSEFLQQDSTIFNLLEQRGIREAHQVQSILTCVTSWERILAVQSATHATTASCQLGINNQSKLEALQALIQRIVVGRESVQIHIRLNALLDGTKEQSQQGTKMVTEQDIHLLSVPIQLKRSGLAMRLIVAGEMQERGADPRLIQLLAKGHDWFERLVSGKAKSLMEISVKESVESNYVTRVINLTFLAPDIIKAIIEGRQPATVTADTIMDQFPLPIDWADQRRLLGFRP